MAEFESIDRGFQGLRVLSLESRLAEQMAKLIENEGGIAVSAPSMREIPVRENSAALQFAEDLFVGKFDIVIFLTGVGTRILFEAVATQYPRQNLVEALSRIAVVARGPKPVAALRQFGVPIRFTVPEPNTWRELVKALDEDSALSPLAGKRIAIQEYGVSNRELTKAIEARGASVTRVPIYQWGLPENLEPLRQAIAEIVRGSINVVLLTSATQIDHLMQVAAERGLQDAVRRALLRVVVASVGPICTETLRRHGISVDLEPSHPKMGHLVREAAQKARLVLARKRALG